MLDYNYAKEQFEKYISNYDLNNKRIKLKYIHTYGVVACATIIAQEEHLCKEEITLSKIIALLHDIGRFEQLKRFDSFDDRNIDHALLAVKYLFDEKHLEDFVKDRSYDEVIKTAIALHSKYQVELNYDEQTNRQVLLIRDADKLDNFRVKNIESLSTMLDVTEDELKTQTISENIYQDMLASKLILASNRKTKLDVWMSYIAFIFDLNYRGSYQYIKDKNYINKNIERIDYQNKVTIKMIEQIKAHCNKFIQEKLDNEKEG